MNLYPIPDIGAKGSFVLAAPFNTILLPTDEYTCMAVRSINDYVVNSEDVFDLVYSPVGLTEANYQHDITVNMPILSLQSQVGHWVYVPASYVTAYPNSNGVPYHNLMIGVYIGAMPVGINLGFLTTALSNTVIDNIGVTPNIKEVEVSAVSIITETQNSQVKAARLAVVAGNSTDTARYKALLVNYNNALTKIQALETYLLANASKLGIT